MVKGRISSSSKESAPSEVTIRRVSESQRLRIIANKVSVVLNSGDFLSDIDMCEEIDSCDVENDAASFRRGIGQKANGSVDSTKGHNNLEDNGLELPSNGFSPVSFYGPRKQHFTSGVNIFSPNTHKISTDKLGDTISRNSPGVKRKGTKQSSSSMVKKKRKTFTVTRQCKSNGHKNKHALTIIENYSHICVKESMIREPSDVRNATENKKEEDFCQSVTNGVQGSCGEGISSINLGDESGAASASDSSPHGSERSITSPISGKPFCCNPSESESVCSEMSLHSGPGSVRDNLFLRKNGSEYFFTNSTESEDNSTTEKLTSHQISENSPLESTINSLLIPRPSCTHKSGKDLIIDSQSSLSCSLPSPSTSESDTTVKLSERDTDSCSSKSSPERQVPITRYFKSMTGAKHRLKPTANGITSPRMSLAENSSDIKNSRVSPPKGKKSGKKQEQMYLDLGQKDFGHVTCPTCGMVYTRAQPDDEAAHIRHHKSFVSGLRFTGWKNECVIKEFHDGRVIMVGPDDHPLHLKKVEEVRKVVDSELGFVADVPCVKSEAKTFLFISARKVVGCAVAVQIDQGYPVLPSPGESSTPEKKIAAWCCSTTPQSAQCGISRIWVHSQHRRKKVATRLLDCVRMNIIYGCIIPRDLVAFSDPTPDGKRLAKSYAGTSQFLVFR